MVCQDWPIIQEFYLILTINLYLVEASRNYSSRPGFAYPFEYSFHNSSWEVISLRKALPLGYSYRPPVYSLRLYSHTLCSAPQLHWSVCKDTPDILLVTSLVVLVITSALIPSDMRSGILELYGLKNSQLIWECSNFPHNKLCKSNEHTILFKILWCY